MVVENEMRDFERYINSGNRGYTLFNLFDGDFWVWFLGWVIYMFCVKLVGDLVYGY